ncbi:MAG: penicillin-binding protein 2 [Phycisphaeraceae bacterium]
MTSRDAGSAPVRWIRRARSPVLARIGRPRLANWRSAGSDGGGGRVVWVGALAVVLLGTLMILLLARVAQLQLDPAPPVARLLDSQTSSRELLARRGPLLDRQGRTLASTRVARRLFVDPRLIVERNTFAEHVAYNLDLEPAAIARQLWERRGSRYVVIDERLDDTRLVQARELDLPGLALEPVLVRDYPHAELAGQLIGFVGVDGRGLEGLEARFDPILRPEPGRLEYLRDARRRPLWIEAGAHHPHEDGQAVHLSLDITIQAMAEQALADTVEQYGAAGGQLVVMDPRNGEILALANHPAFNPNDYRRSEAAHRRNRVVTDVFEPGSIFKPFVWAALTQHGAARPGEIIDTGPGTYRSPRGRSLRDVSPHGAISWDEVLMRSSNIGMAIVAQRVDIPELYEIVARFGFGQTTGSNLPGEVRGILNPLPTWNHYSHTSVPMGQEIGATAMQLMRAFAVIANDGLLVTPTVLRIDPDDPFAGLRERILRADVAAHTRAVLHRAVNEGTARRARSDYYRLFGKTGTAQLADLEHGGYEPGAYVASFLAGAPLAEPRLVIGCFIHRPDVDEAYYGGIVAAPPVKQVMEQALTYLGVPPDVQAEPARVSHRDRR